MKRLFVLFLVLLALMVFTLPLLAQEETAVPVDAAINGQPVSAYLLTVEEVPAESPPFTAPGINDVTNAAYLALLAAFSTAIASPLTSVIVSILKRLPVKFIQDMKADQINLIVAVILSGLTWGASLLGLTTHLDTVFKVLYALLPIVAGVGGNYLANKAVYEKVYRPAAIPIAGFSKTGALPY